MKRLLAIACLIVAVLQPKLSAGDAPEYLRFFDPSSGFKPAQPNLSQIFLQIAGSLECTGSPESYVRHMQHEHERISKKFAAATGQSHSSRMPAHMTPEYLDRLISNWNALSPKLGLDALAKEIGRCAREGIRGTRDTGTLAVQIFNEHQKLVAQQMQSGVKQIANFDRLREQLETHLEFNKQEIDTTGYETTRRDAVTYASVARVKVERLYSKIDAALPAEKAAKIKAAITGVFLDLGELAQSELEVAILEFSLTR